MRGGNGARLTGGEPTAHVVGSLSEFGNDVATLAELQAKLAVLDMKESAGRAAVPAIVIAGGLVLIAASLPVALIGASELLAAALHLTQPGWAYLIVAAVAIVIAGAIAAVAASRLSHSFDAFRRSREELTRNIAWIRTVLVHSRRAPRIR